MKKKNILILTSSILLVSLSVPFLINETTKNHLNDVELNTNNTLNENNENLNTRSDGKKLFKDVWITPELKSVSAGWYLDSANGIGFVRENVRFPQKNSCYFSSSVADVWEVDIDRWDFNFNYEISNFSTVFNNFIIGDVKNYDGFQDIIFDIVEADKNIHWSTSLASSWDWRDCWFNNINKNNYGLFSKISSGDIEYNDKHWDLIESDDNATIRIKNIFNKKTNFSNSHGWASFTDKGNFDSEDRTTVEMWTRLKYDYGWDKLFLYQENQLFSREDSRHLENQPDAISEIKITKLNPNIKINVIVPYTKYDVKMFKTCFEERLCKPIRINKSNSPIIFDYRNGSYISDNEKFVKEEINKRINDFYNQYTILNKLGFITKRSSNSNQYISTGATNIELVIPDTVRGRVGSQEVSVKLKLTNNRYFYFDDNKAENYISFPLKIFLNLNPEINFEIDDLVEVIPYRSANDENGDSYIKRINEQTELGNNKGNNTRIGDFNQNINAKNNLGEYPLVDNRKFPIINEVGTIITIDLEFKINDLSIKKSLTFNPLFNNGRLITVPVSINENDLLGTNVRFKNNELEFGIKMFKDEINFFNVTPLNFLNVNENDNISLSIIGATAKIPVEQDTIDSKWYQIKDRRYYNNNQLEYVGKFETFDPFVFKFHAAKIQIKHPITGQDMSKESKYRPYIRFSEFKEPKENGNNNNNNNSNNQSSSNSDFPIYPKPDTSHDKDDDSIFIINLGTILEKHKEELKNGKFNFQIVIKEFDTNDKNPNVEDRYKIERWILEVTLNMSLDQAKFCMNDYKGNKLIENENKEKYFNKKNPYYRGDYIDENTGMYFPKVVWVNAYPPKGFLYDPLNADGKRVVPDEGTTEEQALAAKKAKYDIGYIAELNATGFSNNDYVAVPTIGGYDTIFNTETFVPTGETPYSEYYKFDKNNIEPNIIRIPLDHSGSQTIKSTEDFRQVVLKRANTNNYLYQFIKIADNSKEIVSHPDLISLYGDLKGLRGEPLFVDFWDTYQGKHLKDFLLKGELYSSEEEIRAIPYSEVVQKWNIYVNDPGHYTQYDISDNTNPNDNDISKLKGDRIDIKENNAYKLKVLVISKIEEWLTNLLENEGWIEPNLKLQYGVHFNIEDSESIFNKKLAELLQNYSLNINDANVTVSFQVSMIESAFESETNRPYGKTQVVVLNNKDIDKIVDLSNYNGSKLIINSRLLNSDKTNNIIDVIKNTIINSINEDFERILKGCELIESGYVPKLNDDYRLEFYVKYLDEGNTVQKHYYHSFEKAIEDDLLYETNKNSFYNILNINVIANSTGNSIFMKNSFSKTIINDSSQKKPITSVQPFNISSINAHDIKVNTKLIENEKDDTIESRLYNLILERVNNDILFYARKWIYLSNIVPKFNTDYEIVFIRKFDENNQPIYYENDLMTDEIYQIINQHLINGINNESAFNRDLYFEVRAKKTGMLEGKFIKKINNNYSNKAIEKDDILNEDININQGVDGDNNNSNNNNSNNEETENIKTNLNNKKGKGDDFNWWWVITPLTIFVISVITLIIIYCVRKNRRIR